MNGLETTLLRLYGIPQETIDEIDKSLPAVAALVKLAQDNEDLIRQVMKVAAEAQPLAAQMLPLIDKAMVEVQTVLPAIKDIIAFEHRPPAPAVDIAALRDAAGTG